MKRFLSAMLTLLMLCSIVLAESAEDPVIATVNGEELTYSEYYAIESALTANYQTTMTDETTYAYLQDMALSYAVEQMLIRQDMHAQGCYDFDEESETWFLQAGQAAYETALADVKAALLNAQPDMAADEADVYALAYAKSLNVTIDTYVDYYRTQYASQRYYEWLTQDNPVTDADVQAAYEARVAEGKTLYMQDAAAFETALYSNQEAWYRPEGYRAVLQILLPAEGDTDDARLQSVQATVGAIASRLNAGEPFQTLMDEYSTDVNGTDENFLATGYQVHQDSVVWEDAFIQAAFSEAMTAPGAVSAPFVSELGVHILYYLADVPGGPIELTNELRDALHYYIFTQRYTEAQTKRIDVLADTAEVIFH